MLLSFIYFGLNNPGNNWNSLFKFMACDSVDFSYYYENLRAHMGKWNFKSRKSEKKLRKIGVALLMTHLWKCGRKISIWTPGRVNYLLPHIKIMCTYLTFYDSELNWRKTCVLFCTLFNVNHLKHQNCLLRVLTSVSL